MKKSSRICTQLDRLFKAKYKNGQRMRKMGKQKRDKVKGSTDGRKVSTGESMEQSFHQDFLKWESTLPKKKSLYKAKQFLHIDIKIFTRPESFHKNNQINEVKQNSLSFLIYTCSKNGTYYVSGNDVCPSICKPFFFG